MGPLKQHNDELSWQAFQYVAGEMSVDESVAFEARMLDDVVACDAVARMALICDVANAAFEPTIAVAPPKAVQCRSRRLVYRTSFVGLALLACVGVLVSFSRFEQRRNNAQIVSLWSSVADESVATLDDSDPPVLDGVQHSDLVVPDWLIAAVQLETDGDDDVLEN